MVDVEEGLHAEGEFFGDGAGGENGFTVFVPMANQELQGLFVAGGDGAGGAVAGLEADVDGVECAQGGGCDGGGDSGGGDGGDGGE